MAAQPAIKSWIKCSLHEASSALSKGLVSSEQLTYECIQQSIKKRGCNLFITEDFDAAIEKAIESDKRRLNGKTLSPIDGIPVAYKDIFCTKGIRTTAASRILENFTPAYESTATNKLNEAGAISLGKLNMDEFAMGSANIYSAFGPSINPWSEDIKSNPMVTGGSSGGSAAAVASGCCFAALGSDTGGSVRLPAAYCGVVGLKPQYGRISRHGMISFASSLDTVGIFTRSVQDASIILSTIAGFDDKDSTCLKEDIPKEWSSETTSLKGFKVGIPNEYYVAELPKAILQVWENGLHLLELSGAELIPVSLPFTKYALPAYYIIASAEASSNLSRYDGVRYGRSSSSILSKQYQDANALHEAYRKTRSEGFGLEVQRRILSGSYVLSAGAYSDYYEKAIATRKEIKKDFDKVFSLSKVHALLTPTTPSAPYNLKQLLSPTVMYLNDIMTIPASLAGLPAISIPISLSQDHQQMPLGLQLIGPSMKEENIFRAALALEASANFTSLIPDHVYH